MNEPVDELFGRAVSDSDREPWSAAPEGGTGNPDVDAVVGSLTALDDLPVADHVAVFEQAHASLRRTLAGAGADTSPVASPVTNQDDSAVGRS
jgi:hypothetical protein